MSATVQPEVGMSRNALRGRALWSRQIRSVLRIEIKKNLLSGRAVLIYLLAGIPVFLFTLFAMFAPASNSPEAAGEMNEVFSGIFEGLVLRTIIYFGCAWLFMNLFRGEVVDRSLHFYFLSPLRRDVLVAGKYLSGVIASVALFVPMTVVSYLLLFGTRSATMIQQHFGAGHGIRHLLLYGTVTALACVGYGAVFLIVGLFFRNPIIPAVLIYGWESINFLLPPILKKISVIHYLKSLMPVVMSEGPFAVLADPTPASIGVPGLLVFTGVLLAFAGFRIRSMEISYGGE